MRWLLVACAFVWLHSLAQAPWPAKPIRIIVANAGGAAPDLAARVFNENFARLAGRPVTLENRPGADGYIAAEAVMRAEPDGHTLFFATQSLFAIDPFVKKKQPMDPMRVFLPLAVVFDDTGPTGIFVGAGSPFNAWPELVAYGKANPGKLDFAASVPLFKMLGTWISRRAGFQWQEIPYKGGAQANQDVIGGRVAVIITAFGPLEPTVKAGKLRVLALTKRASDYPQVPQIADLYPGFSQPAFVVLAAPAGMAPALAQRINRIAATIVEDASFNKDVGHVRFANHEGARSVEGTMEFIRGRREEWQRFIREAGIQPE
jgi:tripartite-type tricarboxylate transporter receptor subunit TctC